PILFYRVCQCAVIHFRDGNAIFGEMIAYGNTIEMDGATVCKGKQRLITTSLYQSFFGHVCDVICRRLCRFVYIKQAHTNEEDYRRRSYCNFTESPYLFTMHFAIKYLPHICKMLFGQIRINFEFGIVMFSIPLFNPYALFFGTLTVQITTQNIFSMLLFFQLFSLFSVYIQR